MRSWLLLLAGPLIWTAHFLAIYAVASIAALLEQTGEAWPRIAIAIATVVGIVVLLGALMLVGRREGPLARFNRNIAIGGVILGLIAIVWQALPALAL